MPTIGIFPLQRQIIKRERSSGTYRSSSAYLAKVLSTIPLATIGALLLAVPVYWMVGLQKDVAKYFIFILIVWLHSMVSNFMGIMISSAVPTVQGTCFPLVESG